MVKLTRIYTRGGDGGQTSLGDGARVAKHDPRVAAYGTVDEANATIGLARLHTAGEFDEILARVQNDLFDLGADLCRPEGRDEGRAPLRVSVLEPTLTTSPAPTPRSMLGMRLPALLCAIIFAPVAATTPLLPPVWSPCS